MNDKYIVKQQKRIISFIRKYGGKKPLSILAEDSCSELCELLSCWILKDYHETSITMLKGDRILGTKRSHNIIVLDQDHTKLLLDPSVWQFFKRKRSVVVGNVKTINETLALAQNIYGGKWSISEKINVGIFNKIDQL